MKKFFATAFLALATTIASACWFTESNFNNTYIASVNGRYIHYTEASAISNAIYKNRMEVPLPLSVQIKVSSRFGDQTGEVGNVPISEVILQYKVVKANGTDTNEWITVGTLDNPTWDMNFAKPVTLFKKGLIDPAGIAQGDWIIMRVWMLSGVYHTGDLDDDISIADIPASQSASNVNIGTTSWKAPHVFLVKYNGKKRLVI